MISTSNQMFDPLDTAPPADVEAEKWVLGSIFLSVDLLDDLGGLRADDFYDPAHAAIFAEMLSQVAKGLPVHDAIVQKHLGDDDAKARVYEIAASVPVAHHVMHYAAIVRQKAALRRLRVVAMNLLSDTRNQKDAPEAILERSEAALSDIRLGTDETEPVAIRAATIEAIAHIDAIQQRGNAAGVLTGLESFDHDQGGLFPGELIILAARPGVGKTSFALQVAHHVAAKSRLVYFASLEMSAVELSTRLACSLSGVSSRLVRTGRLTNQDAHQLNDAMTKQSNATLDIHDQAGLTVGEIRRQIRRRKKRGLVLAVVDYLQLLTAEDRRLPREQQVARITKSLKETAREYEVPILCLCQLNRLADGEEQPKLAHLRESGAIEQDADMVLFLAPHKPTDLHRNNASLIVAKNRNGETGPIPLDWHPSQTRFTCTEPICEEWTP